MRTALLFVLSLCLLAGSVRGVAAEAVDAYPPKGDKKSPKQDTKDPTDSDNQKSKNEDTLGPIGVFADIEEAWKKEDVGKILRHYGKKKVAIAIEGIGPRGGEFSKNQSHYLFKDLFKYTITTKFEFVQYRNISDDRVKVYAVAERTYKRKDDGRLFEDKIYVSLQLEDDSWVISEIKSVR